jgi:hypothetical protein
MEALIAFGLMVISWALSSIVEHLKALKWLDPAVIAEHDRRAARAGERQANKLAEKEQKAAAKAEKRSARFRE